MSPAYPVNEPPEGTGIIDFDPGVPFPNQFMTAPDSITHHMLTDAEMIGLTKVERPFSLAIGSAALGAWLGLMPMFIQFVDGTIPVSVGSMALVASIWGGSLIAAVTCGSYALRGRHNCEKLLQEIRERPRKPLSRSQTSTGYGLPKYGLFTTPGTIE